MPLMCIEFRSSYAKKKMVVNVNIAGAYTIGSNGSSGIILEGAGVRGQHARILIVDKGFAIEPIDQSPVAVNGHPINGPARLDDGDWLALDKMLFQVRITRDQENRPIETLRAGPVEVPPSGSNKSSGTITIGRLPDCDIEIESPIVSREHARLVWQSGGWVLEDLHSTNGTPPAEQPTPAESNDGGGGGGGGCTLGTNADFDPTLLILLGLSTWSLARRRAARTSRVA